jgi:tRNA (guanine9-N1)-methyltransferase
MIYVIGGIVDHNRLKKITLNFAVENGIAVKRLPMGNIQLKASVHLAVNHVW